MSGNIATLRAGKGHIAHNFAYRNEPAWHGLGTHMSDEATNAEVAAAAGVHGTVTVESVRDVLAGTGAIVTTTDAMVFQNLPDGTRIVRATGVSDGFTPWQPDDMLAVIDSITQGGAKLDTVGLLGTGALAFMSFRLADLTVAGDMINPYLTLRTGWNGRQSRQIDVKPIRAVCANTLNAVFTGKSDTRITVRNTRNANGMINAEEARRTLGIAFETSDSWAKEYERLCETVVTDDMFSRMVKDLFPDAENEGRGQTRRENARGLLTEIYKTGAAEHPTLKIRPRLDTIGETRGSVAGVLNAVNELFTWYQPVRQSDGDFDWNGYSTKIAGLNELNLNAQSEAFGKVLAVAGIN